MATIRDLLQQDLDIAAAESAALTDLAAYLRDAAVSLPDGSNLARSFARHSIKFDEWARHRGHEAQMGDIELHALLRDVDTDLGGEG